MNRSIKKPDQSSNPTGAPAEIQRRIILARLVASGEKIGNFCQFGVLKMCWNWVHSSPLQSIQVRLRGVGACYLTGFRTVGEESTAFTRQGPLFTNSVCERTPNDCRRHQEADTVYLFKCRRLCSIACKTGCFLSIIYIILRSNQDNFWDMFYVTHSLS